LAILSFFFLPFSLYCLSSQISRPGYACLERPPFVLVYRNSSHFTLVRTFPVFISFYDIVFTFRWHYFLVLPLIFIPRSGLRPPPSFLGVFLLFSPQGDDVLDPSVQAYLFLSPFLSPFSFFFSFAVAPVANMNS